MPTTLTAPPPAALPIDPPRKRWTRAQCEELEKAGLLEQERLELVDGELIDMSKNRPHVNAQVFLFIWLAEIFGMKFVNQEAPIDVAPKDHLNNEPVPDLIVLKQPTHQLTSGNPQPADLRLVIEVSHSTLHFDLTKKAALYARAGIEDYWVLDVTGRRMFVPPRTPEWPIPIRYRVCRGRERRAFGGPPSAVPDPFRFSA